MNQSCWRKYNRCSIHLQQLQNGLLGVHHSHVAAAPRLLGEVRVTQASAAVSRLLASPMEEVHDGAYRVEYS